MFALLIHANTNSDYKAWTNVRTVQTMLRNFLLLCNLVSFAQLVDTCCAKFTWGVEDRRIPYKSKGVWSSEYIL